MAAKEHTAIRADVGDLARADALAPRMSSPGLTLTRSDVMRMALALGLSALELDTTGNKPLDGVPVCGCAAPRNLGTAPPMCGKCGRLIYEAAVEQTKGRAGK